MHPPPPDAAIARDYAPCDIVIADIEADTHGERGRFAVDICHELSMRNTQ